MKKILEKRCTGPCKLIKPITDFYRGGKCKECFKSSERNKRAQHKLNPPKQNQHDVKYCNGCEKYHSVTMFRNNRAKCIDCEREYGRKYRASTIGRNKATEWINNNKFKMKTLQANWYQENKQQIRKKYNNKYKNDIEFKLHATCMRRIQLALKKNKTDHTVKYLGCSISLYKKWLDYCFEKNMEVSNYGTIWHVDHVIPVNTFNLNEQNNVYMCFNWRNTVPMYAELNLKKHDKIDHQQIKNHLLNLRVFHKIYDIELPKQYEQLFARHLNNREFP